jgi:hypothetical protein
MVVVHRCGWETFLCALSVTLFLKQIYAVPTSCVRFYPTEPSPDGASAASGYQTREHRPGSVVWKVMPQLSGTDGSMMGIASP